jgi:hypothetical protein
VLDPADAALLVPGVDAGRLDVVEESSVAPMGGRHVALQLVELVVVRVRGRNARDPFEGLKALCQAINVKNLQEWQATGAI